jgi:hypothetical protein
MGSFWLRIYVVKKRPCTGHIFLIGDAQFLAIQRPLCSLFTCCYLLGSALHRLCWLSHLKLQSSIRSFCQSKGFALV